MSRWTHIVGAMHIDTFRTYNDIEEYVRKKLKEAPEIIGSEGNASIFVNKENGYCIFCNKGEFQSRAIITIQGDLRDKDGSTTKKEVEKFIDYIKKLGWYIRIFVINIEDECSQGESYILKGENDYE